MTQEEYDKLSKRNKILIEAYDKGYRVEKDGTIIGLTKTLNGDIHDVYRRFHIKSDMTKTSQSVQVHRFQAYQKFGDKIFEPGIEVRHLNGDSLDNSWDNIGIGTPHDNHMDKKPEDRLTHSLKATTKIRRLTKEQYYEFMNDRASGFTYRQLMAKWGFPKSTISYIVNGKTYRYLDRM